MYHLYGTEGCHLCELALEICINGLGKDSFTEVDIIDDKNLVELYGIHIPVLENTKTGTKLYWPFSEQDLDKIKN